MLVRLHRRHSTVLLRAGMGCLAAGMLSLRYLSAWTGLQSNLADGVAGLCYGLAIGCLLLSMRMRRCKPSDDLRASR